MAAAVCLAGISTRTVISAGLPSRGTVVDVYDGDTITVEAEGAKHRVRLLGIDAPEMNYNTLWSEMEKLEKFTSLSARRELHEARGKFERWARLVRAYARASRVMARRTRPGKGSPPRL